MTKNSTKLVKILVQNVGQSFGCEGYLVDALSGVTLHSTDTYPRGNRAVAYDAALSLAAKHGYQVVSDPWAEN